MLLVLRFRVILEELDTDRTLQDVLIGYLHRSPQLLRRIRRMVLVSVLRQLVPPLERAVAEWTWNATSAVLVRVSNGIGHYGERSGAHKTIGNL